MTLETAFVLVEWTDDGRELRQVKPVLTGLTITMIGIKPSTDRGRNFLNASFGRVLHFRLDFPCRTVCSREMSFF